MPLFREDGLPFEEWWGNFRKSGQAAMRNKDLEGYATEETPKTNLRNVTKPHPSSKGTSSSSPPIVAHSTEPTLPKQFQKLLFPTEPGLTANLEKRIAEKNKQGRFQTEVKSEEKEIHPELETRRIREMCTMLERKVDEARLKRTRSSGLAVSREEKKLNLIKTLESFNTPSVFMEVLPVIRLSSAKAILQFLLRRDVKQARVFLEHIVSVSTSRPGLAYQAIQTISTWHETTFSSLKGPRTETILFSTAERWSILGEEGRRILVLAATLGDGMDPRRFDEPRIHRKENFRTLSGKQLGVLLEGYIQRENGVRDDSGMVEGNHVTDGDRILTILKRYLNLRPRNPIKTVTELKVAERQAEARWLSYRILAIVIGKTPLSISMDCFNLLSSYTWLPPILRKRNSSDPEYEMELYVGMIDSLVAKREYNQATQMLNRGDHLARRTDTVDGIQRWSDMITDLTARLIAQGNPELLVSLCRYLSDSVYCSHKVAWKLRPKLPTPLLDALYRTNIDNKYKVLLYWSLLGSDSHPPKDQALVDMARYVSAKPITTFNAEGTRGPVFASLASAVIRHPEYLSPVHRPALIAMVGNHSLSKTDAKKLYEAALRPTNGELAINMVKTDPEVLLALVREFGTSKPSSGQENPLLTPLHNQHPPEVNHSPRDREFANQVIRNFVLASPPVDQISSDSLTALQQAFHMVDSPQSAFSLLKYITKSKREPTKGDLVGLLEWVMREDTEAGMGLIEVAVEKGVLSVEDAEGLRAQFERGGKPAANEKRKE